MKLLVKSTYLFIFGIYADLSKRRFDLLMDRAIRSGGDISSPSLTRLSNRCCALYERFLDYEKSIKADMTRQKSRCKI